MTSGYPSRSYRQLLRAYREELDRVRALKVARRIARWVCSGKLTLTQLDESYEVMALACETLWDLGSPEEAEEVALAWLDMVERTHHEDSDAHRRCLRDVQAYRIVARAMHRARNPDSWHYVCSAYDKLCDRVGGPKTLSRLLRSDPYGGISIGYALLLGIAVPAARRRRGADDRAQGDRFLNDALIVAELLASDPERDICKYHALVAMAFQAVCSRGLPSDRALVERLLLLDDRARPRDQRGEVTRLVVRATYHEYVGDKAEAVRCAALSNELLATAGMFRHLEELKLHRAA